MIVHLLEACHGITTSVGREVSLNHRLGIGDILTDRLHPGVSLGRRWVSSFGAAREVNNAGSKCRQRDAAAFSSSFPDLLLVRVPDDDDPPRAWRDEGAIRTG